MSNVSLRLMLSGIAVLLFANMQPFKYIEALFFNFSILPYYNQYITLILAIGGLALVLVGAFRRN